MKFSSKVELTSEKNDKCRIVCNQDCQWGEVFDFASYIKSFAAQKIQESEQANEPEKLEPKE